MAEKFEVSEKFQCTYETKNEMIYVTVEGMGKDCTQLGEQKDCPDSLAEIIAHQIIRNKGIEMKN